MATKKPVKSTKPATRVDNLIHEIGRTDHRIVFVPAQGGIEPGEWVPHKEIATHGLVMACHSDHAGKLPTGLFTVKRVGALVLM